MDAKFERVSQYFHWEQKQNITHFVQSVYTHTHIYVYYDRKICKNKRKCECYSYMKTSEVYMSMYVYCANVSYAFLYKSSMYTVYIHSYHYSIDNY